jgi:UDP-N-acetylglucosamine diphosphorylase / glucose-1-phosphate thymidylyltransferase / UDP-N-acetylgalactosamine diphosphorylase / glucosamine-1-phosphate N-acetyltransferase / galactosamine-1-phosphate N-acetyltransferase
MQKLFSRHFFSFEEFEHKKLFNAETPAWNALRLLSSYLEKAELGKIETEIPPTAYLINSSQISIAKGSIIEPGAYIEGPAILGPRTVVRHGAYIKGFVITGEDCVIGHATEVKRSILLNRVHAAHFNYVGDSILGNDVNLGAGVKLANLRFDHAPVTFLYQGQKIVTHLDKFGAIIGDNTQIGCNAVTNPGTMIGPHSFCYPCVNIVGVIPPRSVYKGSKLPYKRSKKTGIIG